MIRFGLKRIITVAMLLLILGWTGWEWWPRPPLTPGTPQLQPGKKVQRIVTVVPDDWEQFDPNKIMETQAAKFPGQYWLSGPGNRRMVALTFDDGPTEYSRQLLDVLAKHHVKATFFWLGLRLEDSPDIVRRAYLEGHTLGSHGFDHGELVPLDAPPKADGTMIAMEDSYVWDEQFGRTQAIYQRLLGVTPALMRPPYGRMNNDQIGMMRQHGLTVIQWSLDTRDWFRNRMLFGTHNIVRAVQDNLHEEAIILMHDGGGKRSQTVEAVDQLIPWLKASGYELVTIDQLLGIPAYQKSPKPAAPVTHKP
ncbi:polysaccharide deacetylase family protein [Chitinilyticum aquatile]|uniref:polysaccharide deacetylase family protein n=1 Tax=Chitinilyticum aquatile TaxID=362520 RepID=UPI00138B18D0|nr:polysaccharide deacetylase family protein [Chitinilyticum aquatile]